MLFLQKIGQKIKKFRLEKGMTVATLAELAGISKGMLSQIENSRAVPSFQTLFDTLKALDVPPSVFFEGIEFNNRKRF
ncbi:helix-turn-helix transcriptional regulator [Fulvivirgaceae bacterium BMA12]|uniref:Helix-turn-helix transcriptional regulator n=1 Tax=Agaribacillus aureus TaxID=3051825 RepID=A0ABT8LHH9_9BACT|nr:helix-turn-helix transcriptional regulator [Fulvivirgaceae bacterium BMA12]